MKVKVVFLQLFPVPRRESASQFSCANKYFSPCPKIYTNSRLPENIGDIRLCHPFNKVGFVLKP